MRREGGKQELGEIRKNVTITFCHIFALLGSRNVECRQPVGSKLVYLLLDKTQRRELAPRKFTQRAAFFFTLIG